MKEATSEAAASAFLHSWVALFGVPSVVTSDNGVHFLSGIWKGMMSKLNIEVKYSALYRPQAIGLLERQHRSIKDSLKSAIVDLGDTYQDKWLDFLPFTLLGRRNAHQPDLGASSSEYTFGTKVKIPGQLLTDPEDIPPGPRLHQLLENVRKATSNPAVPTSSHNEPEKSLKSIPLDVKYVYTRQHHTKGLQAPYEGPFEIESRPSRSTVKICVGTYKTGEKRYEIRHFNDLKLAHPDSPAACAKRPTLGRPSVQVESPAQTEQQPSQPSPPAPSDPSNRLSSPDNQMSTNPAGENKQTNSSGKSNSANHATSKAEERVPAFHPTSAERGPPPVKPFKSRQPSRATRNPSPKYVDAMWSASEQELNDLNASINK